MDGDSIGVEVSVSTGESSVAIHLSPFSPGMCPVQIMNNLTVPVTFGQKGHKKTSVPPNELAHFTWASIIDEKVLEVDVGEWHFEVRDFLFFELLQLLFCRTNWTKTATETCKSRSRSAASATILTS